MADLTKVELQEYVAELEAANVDFQARLDAQSTPEGDAFEGLRNLIEETQQVLEIVAILRGQWPL